MSTISVNFSRIFGITSFLVVGALCLCAHMKPALAEYKVPDIAHDSSYEKVYIPVMTSTSVMIDNDEKMPQEPNIGKAKFFKYPALTSVSERIDRLLHGIEIYIRPEYDQFGHEIRRYMAHVGNGKIYEDPDFLLKQYRNTKKARVIMKFWKKHLEEEIDQIETILEGDAVVPLSARTAFRQNKTTVRSFIISLNSWIDSNEQILYTIAKDQELYVLEYPEVIVINYKERIAFHNLLSVRAAKLKDIRRYSAFDLMVY